MAQMTPTHGGARRFILRMEPALDGRRADIRLLDQSIGMGYVRPDVAVEGQSLR